MAKCNGCGRKFRDESAGNTCGHCGLDGRHEPIVAEASAHKFEVGDAVEHCQGSIGTVLKLDVGIGGQPSALVQFKDSQTWACCGNLKPATFPIPADKDPWKTSEPGRYIDASTLYCRDLMPSKGNPVPYCTREIGHAGHHVSRDGAGAVNARWKNDSAEAVKAPIAISQADMGRQHESLDQWLQRTASDSPSAPESAVVWRCGECSKLKRELENLTRRHETRMGDCLGEKAELKAELDEAKTSAAFYKRELERLRKRKP